MSNTDFTIEVKITVGDEALPVTLQIDLSDPQFEEKVLRAAGHFSALRRKTRRGRRGRDVKCPHCLEEFASVYSFIHHNCKRAST